MRVLVTGGAGYIGSQVALDLSRYGHQVVILDNLSKGHIESVKTGKFVKGDIGDVNLVKEVLTSEKIDAVMHMAANSLVGESVTNPSKYYNNNITNGLSLLDAMIASNVNKIVFSSTAAVYGEPVEIPITENHPKAPTNPYGRTKLHFEEMLHDFDNAHGMRYMSLRYFNAAGADKEEEMGEDHQPESHLIPIVLQASLGVREKLDLYGTDYSTPDGTCVRDYIHVADLSRAHILALESLEKGSKSTIFNLGNGKGYSNLEVIRVAEKVTGQKIKINQSDRRAGDPAVLVASSDKIRAELNWIPEYPELETIIESAWKWHKTHPHGYKTGSASRISK